MENRTCWVCKKSFKPWSSRVLCCSELCSNAKKKIDNAIYKQKQKNGEPSATESNAKAGRELLERLGKPQSYIDRF